MKRNIIIYSQLPLLARWIWTTFVVAMLPLSMSAQVTLEARIDSMEMLMGEQVQLHVTVKNGIGHNVIFPTFKDNEQMVPGLEVVSSRKDTVGEERKSLEAVYTLTSFEEDSVFLIPSLKVKIDGKEQLTKELSLKVLSVDVDTTNVDNFFPEKSVQDNPFSWSDWRPIFLKSIAVVILAIIISYLIHRLKSGKPIVVKPKFIKKLPAHTRALNDIKALKSQQKDVQGDVKDYYTELTDVLRHYIEERFGFNAMEMTSSEIIEHLQSADDSPAMIRELNQLFETADLVKFAKQLTLLDENDRNLMNAVEFITSTRSDDKPVIEKVETPSVKIYEQQMVVRRVIIGVIVVLSLVAVVLLALVFYGIYLI